MDRRQFLQNAVLTTAVAQAPVASAQVNADPPVPIDTTGHTLQCKFQHDGIVWKVFEDLSRRDGPITFVPSRGVARVMTKRLEACFSQADVPFLGLTQQ